MDANETKHRGTVMIVDDDAAVRDSLSTLLEAYELGVEAYESIATFKQAYRPHSLSCLILDQHMPVTSGLEFLASPEGKRLSLPVILITAQSDDDIRAKAKELGVFAFLTKPVAGDELMAVIGNAIDYSAAKQPHAS